MAEQVNAPITISMALDMRRNRIRIHKPTIHLLGDPTLLQLLFDPEDMVVAIVCRDTEVSGGQEVRINPRGLKSRNCFARFNNQYLHGDPPYHQRQKCSQNAPQPEDAPSRCSAG